MRKRNRLHFIACLSVEVCELLQMFSTVTVPSSFLHVFFITLLTLEFSFFVVTSPHFLPMLGSLPVPFSSYSESLSLANFIYFSEWIFVTDSQNECVFGVSEMVIKSIDLCEIFGCYSKKRWRRKQKSHLGLRLQFQRLGIIWRFNGKGSNYCIICDLWPLVI